MSYGPFGGNLLPRGARGGNIKFNPRGSQHVSIYGNGKHISYDRTGYNVSGVHTTEGKGRNKIRRNYGS